MAIITRAIIAMISPIFKVELSVNEDIQLVLNEAFALINFVWSVVLSIKMFLEHAMNHKG